MCHLPFHRGGESDRRSLLAGVASWAGNRVGGLSASEYLRRSILEPNSYIVDDFPQGVMYQKFKDTLTVEQCNNLVAYLMTLK